MGSKYPPSVRGCLPLWTLTLEVAFILVFCFFMDYDSSSKDHKALMGTYGAIFQDVTVMAALGLGFLTSSLWKQGWSSVAFNLFMLALGVQWSVLLNGFLNQNMVITLSSMQQATMSSMSPLISVGAVLGKVNLVQLVVMTLMEVTVFDTMRMVSKKFLHMPDYINMMYIHVFAACFGLTVAWHFTKPLPKGAQKKDQMARSPSLFAMLGTLFLWIFWPSFNSALLHSLPDRKIAVFNTYYALAVSTVTAISLSALAHPQGKINMAYIHNAVLAGGVAVGAPSHLIDSPWIAMVLGLITGLMSSMETKSLPEHFNHVMWTHDTCGVGYTFGLPGVLGGITNIILAVYHTRNHDLVFMNFGALSLPLFMGMVSGFLTGLLLKLKIWRAVPPVAKYFHDQAFWEFPHLAVGF